jgi:flagellar L-ring protein precursor FlgH
LLIPNLLFQNSLWNSSNSAKFKNIIANRTGTSVGDIVTIVVYESSLTSSKSSNPDFKGGLISAVSNVINSIGSLDLSKFIPIRSNPSPENTDRESSNETKIVLQVAAVVKEVYDNGTVLLVGKKDIKVEDQNLQIMISGIARIEDISRDNSIDSTKLAEANIIYNGQIVFQQNPGQDRWFEWILSALAGVLF